MSLVSTWEGTVLPWFEYIILSSTRAGINAL
jgi:hypothetical protein